MQQISLARERSKSLKKVRHRESIADMVRGMQLAGRFAPETHNDRGRLACIQLNYISTPWTQRKLEPNRGHSREVLADGWCHLLGDQD